MGARGASKPPCMATAGTAPATSVGTWHPCHMADFTNAVSTSQCCVDTRSAVPSSQLAILHQRCQLQAEAMQREADHVEIAALYAAHKAARHALDAYGKGTI